MENLTPQHIADKVYELTEQFNQYVFEHPNILDELPDKAVLIFLDEDDPTFNQANLALAETTPIASDSQRVHVSMRKHVQLIHHVQWEPRILASALAT